MKNFAQEANSETLKSKRNPLSINSDNFKLVSRTKYKDLMKTIAFRVGVEDVLNGNGFHEEYDKLHIKMQWIYERGRQFAIQSGIKSLKAIYHYKKVRPEMVQLYKQFRTEEAEQKKVMMSMKI